MRLKSKNNLCTNCQKYLDPQNEITPDNFLIKRRMEQFLIALENDPQYKLSTLNECIKKMENYQQELIENVQNQQPSYFKCKKI